MGLRAPVRKVYYNLMVTGTSVIVAFLVGGVGLLGLVAERMRHSNGPVAWVASLNLENFGFLICGLFRQRGWQRSPTGSWAESRPAIRCRNDCLQPAAALSA